MSALVGLVMVVIMFWITSRAKRRAGRAVLTAPEPVTGTGPAWEQDSPWVLDMEDDL